MSRRTPVFVLGLTLGDYLLWNWSLNSNHDLIALASGVTLPPLALASLWVLAVGVARLIALTAQQPAKRRRTARDAPRGHGASSPANGPTGEGQPAQTAPSGPAPGKIAA